MEERLVKNREAMEEAVRGAHPSLVVIDRARNIGEDPEFAARISAYDTAFKMQTEAPEVFDLTREPKETLELYGVSEPTRNFRASDFSRNRVDGACCGIRQSQA
jgi:hypothetical protein